ncbi:hypothetical protein [Mycobacterium sp. PSTR-4-N]|uniref:hypothetical protein n=1 Tax=Mycobacterium sp. PSTR-4-N TaxID=2917745 RepID=UPI001F151B5A|nr:hypothetical protein [Mycobacterium sp. PSTR-4-N]MCG7594443.1 hypothetical protein [Mycobacterium sp. PSTR-4-N]
MKPAAPVTSVRIGSPYRRRPRFPRIRTVAGDMRWVARAAVAVIALHLAVRAVLAFGGYFYWDDLILVGRAGTQPLLSPGYLFDDHDGHVMPGAFLVAGLITRVAPLNWIGPAISLLVLALVASVALLRALHVILGWRPALLVPLTFALFTPLAVPSFAWWAAGLNSLPMVAALAWVCADAIQLVRTGAVRYAVTGTAVFFGGLLFFEKAAIIPFAAFAITAVYGHVTAEATVPQVWRRGRHLWLACLALTVAWVGVYIAVVDQQRWSFDLAMTWDLLWRSVTHGIVPGLVGGPWEWQRWAPASPWATPPVAVMVLGWVALATVAVLTVRRRRRLGPVWAVALGYAVACQVPIYLMRSSRFTALELAQTLRYLPDLVVVLTLLAAIGVLAPARHDSPRWSRPLVACGALLFMAGSLYSTSTFLTSWRDNPTRGYLVNARAGLAAARAASSAPMLDQEVDPLVLQRVAWPENLASHMFALLPDRPEFSSATTDPRMLDSSGRIVDALVTWVRSIRPGPDPRCGYLVQPDFPARMPLDGPLLPADWTVELNYLANSDGSILVRLSEGDEVKVPVRPGLNRVFVRLPGAGDAITVRANTAALSVCVASGPVGFLAPR